MGQNYQVKSLCHGSVLCDKKFLPWEVNVKGKVLESSLKVPSNGQIKGS